MTDNLITLDQAKNHLRVSENLEDDLINLFIQTAHDHITNFLNQSIPGIDDDTVPAPISSTALLIVSDLYENRDGASEKDLKENKAISRLLYPYRVGIGI